MATPVENTMTTTRNNAGVGNASDLTYPPDTSNLTDFMQITFYSYQRNSPIKQNQANRVFAITLPLPHQGLGDRYDIMYNKISGGVLGSVLDTGFGTPSFNVVKTTGEVLGAGAQVLIGKAFSTTVLETIKGILPGLTPGVTDADAQGLAEQVIGKTINPNPSLSFAGMNLKTYTFAWKFVPQTPQESTTIQEVIHHFKVAALPQRVGGANFILTYPYIVGITFHGPSTPFIEMSNQGMVIENIAVNYENDGHAQFFKDSGQPVSTLLTVSFQDRSIMTQDQLAVPSPASAGG